MSLPVGLIVAEDPVQIREESADFFLAPGVLALVVIDLVGDVVEKLIQTEDVRATAECLRRSGGAGARSRGCGRRRRRRW
jgi:hypothetical protein